MRYVGDSATYLYINEVLISSAKVAVIVRGSFTLLVLVCFSCFWLFASMTWSDVLSSEIVRLMTRVAFRSYSEWLVVSVKKLWRVSVKCVSSRVIGLARNNSINSRGIRFTRSVNLGSLVIWRYCQLDDKTRSDLWLVDRDFLTQWV